MPTWKRVTLAWLAICGVMGLLLVAFCSPADPVAPSNPYVSDSPK